ncbi:Pimeloyl-ACP methyl ester carboxylesterase [Halobiforma haloterrestris]|uniref:Pimeloyl-ACP methyl ester carboxylesterase n=1 Tax=Natronobacterium haloterrestre TaxID=148448 RepID=A0A1I1FHJ9_NATHA|nr:alpha/beta hydrolase [Halobiforma haloterrestris]SFB98877.1 Pimeloyl-ACP methyl ester carboxylesterase [Halobiforma haloterrestris]
MVTRPPEPSISAPLPSSEAESVVRTVNGVRLHAVVAGDPDDPLVVLLHGFPEFWYGWRDQIEPLVRAGYRVLVPDQRGYNRSDKPLHVRAYRRSTLSQDIVELIESEGEDVAHVVGHDWGGMVAWELGLRRPDVVDRLVVANAPHPTAYLRQWLSNPEQMWRSGYAYVFQLPWLPERLCRYDEFRVLERGLRESAAPGTFSDVDLERYRRAWRHDGALTGMLNWYRASGRYPAAMSRGHVDVPTLVAWGEADRALVPSLAVDSYEFCRDGRLELFPETSHWIQHEAAGRFTDLLVDHLSG